MDFIMDFFASSVNTAATTSTGRSRLPRRQELRRDYSHEDKRASAELPRGEDVMEDNPSRESAEDGFRRKDDRGNGCV